MVFSEINLILDDGEKKPTPEIYMTKKGLELYWKYKGEEHDVERTGYLHEQNKDKYYEWRKQKDEWENSFTPDPDGGIYDQIGNLEIYRKGPGKKPTLTPISDEDYEKYKNWDWIGRQQYNPKMDPMLFRYYNIKPFEPWVMLNISPDWAGKKIQRQNICKLKKVFNSYMKENWYSEWEYVCEAGGNGDHLHLHALCKLGSKYKNVKSTHSHIAKSNFKNQLLKYAKAEGLEGIIKKPGIQSVLIQGEMGEEILADKKDYLIEEKKPAGHKNKTPKALTEVLGVINRGSL